MKISQEGGCLCGAIGYRVTSAPQRVIVCHCTFCQRVTGSAFLVEPIFRETDLVLTGAAPRTYAHRSDESGLAITLHFCGTCATTLYQSFERLPGIVSVAAGTFADPNWFERGPGQCQHIFTRSAQAGVVLPSHVEAFDGHFMQADGSPNKPVIYEHPTPALGQT